MFSTSADIANGVTHESSDNSYRTEGSRSVCGAALSFGTDDMTASTRSLRLLAAAAASFTVLAITIMVLAAKGIVTFQLGLLMLVALVGLYFGFGVLIVVYRFIARLD